MLPMQVLAGYYGDSRVDEYDPFTGIYYRAIEIERENRGFMSKGPSTQVSNISVFNPQTEKHSMLFKDNKIRNINYVLYETGIKNGVVEYNKSSYSRLIKNNALEIPRSPREKLLVSVNIKKNNQDYTELWVSNKYGENLKLLTTFPASHSWHIDVRNSKIRIVSSRNGKFSHKSIEW
jgi:hypothetical protein